MTKLICSDQDGVPFPVLLNLIFKNVALSYKDAAIIVEDGRYIDNR